MFMSVLRDVLRGVVFVLEEVELVEEERRERNWRMCRVLVKM